MFKTEFKLEYEMGTEGAEGIPVIIVAAGGSTRMGGVNKQLLSIKNIPVIARALLKFEECTFVSRIILVGKKEDIFSLQLLAEEYDISKLSDIVEGGFCRQESVLKGFEVLGESEELVLIHDGARPLVTQAVIERVAEGLKNYPAVTCAVRVKDTVKQIDKEGKIISTLKREELVAVQTPQGVRVKEYLAAVNTLGSVAEFTDDTSIMEAAGYTAIAVEGDYKNIKITTPEDVLLAEGYLEQEE